MKGKFMIGFILFSASFFAADSYTGPQSWEGWFDTANSVLRSRGFSPAEEIIIHRGSLTLTVNGRARTSHLPEKRDIHGIMREFLFSYLNCLEPAPLPVHREATMGILLDDLHQESESRGPEQVILKHMYRDLLIRRPGVLGGLWNADFDNGAGGSLKALNGWMAEQGLEPMERQFYRTALKTVEEWLPYVEEETVLPLPPAPKSIETFSPEPLSVRSVVLKSAPGDTQGIHLEGTYIPKGVQTLLLAEYEFPVGDFDLRPFHVGLKIPLQGVDKISLFLFDTGGGKKTEPASFVLSPLIKYPAVLTGARIIPDGNQRVFSFDVESSTDVSAWVVLKTERDGGEISTSLGAVLPAVNFSVEPMNYQMIDLTSGDIPSAYHLYALTNDGFLTRLDSVDEP